MIKCPYCGNDSSEEYNFCVNCEKQIKCTNIECKSLLLADKTRCLNCGKPVFVQETSVNEMNSYIHTIEQTAKTYKERREIHASDNAIGQMTPMLSGIPASRPTRPTTIASANTPLQNAPLLVENTGADQLEDVEIDEGANTTNTSVPVQSDASAKALKLFVLSQEGNLIAKEKDFKGKSKKEQQKRIVILAAWAYNQLLQKPIPSKDYLKAVVTAANLYDENFRKMYFPETLREYITVVGNDSIALNNDGEKKANLILEEIENDEIKGAAYWEASARAGKKVNRTSKEDQQKVELWAKDELDTGSLEIRSLGSVRNYAMFAFWAVTVKLNKAHAIKPKEAYLYILKKYTTVPVEAVEFTKSLSRTENAKFFAKNSEGLYYLQELGQKTVESWIDGTVSPKPEATQ